MTIFKTRDLFILDARFLLNCFRNKKKNANDCIFFLTLVVGLTGKKI